MPDADPLLKDVDPAFYPRLKVFVSADIIGSTAYKQPLDISRDDADYARRRAEWAGIIRGFYKNAYEQFRLHWTDARLTLLKKGDALPGTLLGPPPRFWKTIGDEVLFWKELTDARQIWLTIACWMKTVCSIRKYFNELDEEDAKRLDIKCTMWTAGFPVRNKAILGVENDADSEGFIVNQLRKFYDLDDDSVVADFIGPGIDTGFRIERFASSRKMAISLDVAYILAKTESDDFLGQVEVREFIPSGFGRSGASLSERLKVHYSGSERLEGVLGGFSYPKFWISTVADRSFDQAKVGLYAGSNGQSNPPHGREVAWPQMRIFCESFYDDRAQFLSPPFVLGDKILGKPPGRYRAFLKAAADAGGSPQLGFKL